MKAVEIKTKKLSVKQYIYKITPYLSDIINDHKAIRNESKEWKIQITMHVNFISSKMQETLVLFLYGVITKKLG